MSREDLRNYEDGYLAFVMGQDRDDSEEHYWQVGWDDAEAEETRRNS